MSNCEINSQANIDNFSVKSPVKRRKETRRNASHAHGHFELKDGKQFCKIQSCQKSFSVSTSSTSLIYHLRNEHSIALIVDADDSEAQDEDTIIDKNAKYGAEKQKKINNLLIKFVIQDYQAFNICMSVPFCNFLKALNPKYVIPDRNTLKELINQTYISSKTEIIRKLNNCDTLKSFTSDGWTSNRLDPYLDLTYHFIDHDFKFHQILLDFLEFPHPHDKYNISDTIFEVIFILKFKPLFYKYKFYMKIYFIFLKDFEE